MKDFDMLTGYTPGVIGRITELHALYYSAYWQFAEYFEAKVATELSDYISTYNPAQDRIISLSIGGRIEASISIDGSSSIDNVAHLRWFIVSDALRGKGAGNVLMQEAMSFCAQANHSQVYLWTFQGLGSARHLYEKHGFTLTEERPGEQWGRVVTEQRFDAQINQPA